MCANAITKNTYLILEIRTLAYNYEARRPQSLAGVITHIGDGVFYPHLIKGSVITDISTGGPR